MADPLSFDLRLTPDWLKESDKANPYADYEGEERADRRPFRGDRREGGNRRGGGPPPRRDQRGGRDQRPSGQRPGGQRPSGHRTEGRPEGMRSSQGSHPNRSTDRPRAPRRDEQAPVLDQTEPAPVQIDFLPDDRVFAKIIQQIKQNHAAYPLFGLARMFLERPERHRIRIRSLDNNTMIYQLGDHGPVAMDPAGLERLAFSECRDEYYETQVIEKEPLKGNFTSVARCTLSGRLLGPTNYHTFQKNIRSLYEQRFSRRMSFEEYRRSIEITADPTAVEQWKEEARKITTFRTKKDEQPVVFESLQAVEQHFRGNYLHTVIHPCLAAEISGDTVRFLPDRSIVASIRRARDRENRFPAQMAGALRHGLNQGGLHVFKHKKRILYISTLRPQPFDLDQAAASPGLSAIFSALRSFPRITRKQLAEKVLAKLLGDKAKDEACPEYQQARTNLASDLLWLAKAGHVIEFSDGTLDLPLPPKQVTEKQAVQGHSPAHPETSGHAVDDEPEEQVEPQSDSFADVTEGVPAAEDVESSTPAEPIVNEPAPVEHNAPQDPLIVTETVTSCELNTPDEQPETAQEVSEPLSHPSAHLTEPAPPPMSPRPLTPVTDEPKQISTSLV
ncbi:MAG: hypothetical protein JO308_09015 [Verrucomicrobia bacterium]|nr:hypothetical protein [Verrucomicrobiota bacterium]